MPARINAKTAAEQMGAMERRREQGMRPTVWQVQHDIAAEIEATHPLQAHWLRQIADQHLGGLYAGNVFDRRNR